MTLVAERLGSSLESDRSPEPITPRDTLTRRDLDSARIHAIYADRRGAPTRLLTEALDLITASGENLEDIAQIAANTVAARREHDRLANEIVPHLDWGSVTYADILIRDHHLPRRTIIATNLEENVTYEKNEDDNGLWFRRSQRTSGLAHALQYMQEEITLSSLEPALATPNPVSRHERIAAVRPPEIPPLSANLVPQITQGWAAFEVGIATTESAALHHQKRELLNLALDTAVRAIDNLAEERVLDRAEAYLLAARAMHDLSVTPGLFEEHMSEADAREFRVRGYEMSIEWIRQSISHFSEAFDQPIGTITHETYSQTKAYVDLISAYTHIDDAFYFEGIYRDEYDRAVADLPTHRSIGIHAVMFALRPDHYTVSIDKLPIAA